MNLSQPSSLASVPTVTIPLSGGIDLAPMPARKHFGGGGERGGLDERWLDIKLDVMIRSRCEWRGGWELNSGDWLGPAKRNTQTKSTVGRGEQGEGMIR